MGNILGLTISDFPYHRFKPQFESGVIQGNQARGWTDRPPRVGFLLSPPYFPLRVSQSRPNTSS